MIIVVNEHDLRSMTLESLAELMQRAYGVGFKHAGLSLADKNNQAFTAFKTAMQEVEAQLHEIAQKNVEFLEKYNQDSYNSGAAASLRYLIGKIVIDPKDNDRYVQALSTKEINVPGGAIRFSPEMAERIISILCDESQRILEETKEKQNKERA